MMLATGNCVVHAQEVIDSIDVEDIYDEDDRSAQMDIRFFFGRQDLDERVSVLENLFNCYEWMMGRVANRCAAATSAMMA